MNVNASASHNSLFDIASVKRKEALANGQQIERPQVRKGGIVPSEPAPAAPAAPSNAAQGGTPTGYSYTNRDLQHLMADWGVQGSAYDLNADGTVNVTDMLQMLGGIGAEGKPWSPQMPRDPAKLPMNANTIAHMQIDYGRTDSRYDVTGDGVVNVSDILHVLSNWDHGSGAPPQSLTAPDGTIAAAPAAPLAAEPAAAPPETPPTMDAAIASLAPAPVAPAETPVVATREPTHTLAPAKLRHLSAALIERLTNAGYTDRPPRNIREIVAKLNLEPSDRRALMAKLREHYSNGLGVNLKA